MGDKRKLIGSGKVAAIYLENGYAYKTFHDTYPSDWITYEVHIQNEVYQTTKLKVPKAELVSNVKEIKMEYIHGCTLADRMRKEKYNDALHDLIELQLSIHVYHDLKLDQAHKAFKQQIETSMLSLEHKEKALRALAQIQEKNMLCHFDVHFQNIMYDQSSYYIIDWVNALLGNPVLDVARTYIILKQYAQRLANKYLTIIMNKGSFQMEELQNAITVMAILRLLESDVGDFKIKLLELI